MNSDQNYFNEKNSIIEQLISNGSQNLTPLFRAFSLKRFDSLPQK